MSKTQKTTRGFKFNEFKDTYGQTISIQKSSSACYDRLWLGVINSGPHLNGPTGNKNEKMNNCMHIGKKEARMIVRRLNKFIKTGDL